MTSTQSIALKLRNKWLAYYKFIGDARTGNDPFPEMEQTKLIGKFETAIVRVDEGHLRNDYEEWSAYALELFSGSSEHQHHIEEALWKRAVHCSGNALRRLDK